MRGSHYHAARKDFHGEIVFKHFAALCGIREIKSVVQIGGVKVGCPICLAVVDLHRVFPGHGVLAIRNLNRSESTLGYGP